MLRTRLFLQAWPRASIASTLRTVNIPAMSMHYHAESAVRPEPDLVLKDIADYVHNYRVNSDLAWETARLCLIDTIGCGLEGLRFPECTKLLGPVVKGTIVPNGLHISTTGHSCFVAKRIFQVQESLELTIS
jgi:2-methylcitrate dehydratase